MYARVILLLLSLLVVMPQAINSDNYLGIDDECFRFYMAGNIHYEKGLTYADSLEARARKIGENRSIDIAVIDRCKSAAVGKGILASRSCCHEDLICRLYIKRRS